MKLTLKDVIFKGIEAHKAGKIREADQIYTAILKAHPNHPDVNHNMGVLAVGIGKVEEAITFFRKAIKSNEKIEQFWVSYIDALVKLQKLEEAVSVYQEACEKGIKGEKIENIKKFISANPENSQLKELIKLCDEGSFNIALNQCEEFLKQNPNSPILYNIYGVIQSKLGKIDESIRNYKKALSISPKYAEAYNNLGNAYLAKEFYSKAIDSFQNALKHNPDYTLAYFNLGIAFNKNGESLSAIESYKNALKLNNDYFEANFNLANEFFEKRTMKLL